MGIQGMTNWKFTAFLTIALMLVAGMFSTAMAAANDGHGTMTVAVTGGTDFQTAADPLPQILLANETGYTVTFTYTATADMNGGMVQVAIPGDDWKLPKSGVTVTITGDSETLTAAANTGDRLVFTGADDKLTMIGVKLDADWSDGDALTIVITGGTSAIPRSLYVPPTGNPYREYTFTTTTKAKDGAFRRLLIPDDDPDTPADESDVDPQPKIRVGNVASGRGTIKVSPIVYQSETDRNIQLTFTAAGPMYDVGTTINSNVVITIPQGLGTAADTFPAPMPQTQTANGDEFVSVSRVTGTVQFANPNQRIIADPTAATVTIDITRMEYNSTITLSYRKVDVDPALSTNAVFTATSISGAAATGTVTFDPAADHVRTIAGSGEIKVAPEIVPMDSRQNLVFTYKAHTALTNANLVITQPDDTGWSALTLVMGSANAQADNYVTVSGGGDGVLTIPGNVITLTGLDLPKNGSLTVTIRRAVLASDATPPVPIVAGAYGWGTTLNTGAVTEPMLYIVNVNDDVAFQVLNAAGDAVDTLPHYPAASERNIYFQFTTMTPIKGGKLQFGIPTGWRQPSHTDVAGKARVKLLQRADDTGAFVDDDTATGTPPANLVEKYGADDNVTFTTSGNQITVNIKALAATAAAPRSVTLVYGNGTGDMRGMVQRNAQADLEIIGRFSTGVSGTLYPADSPVVVRVGNVEAGSGTASITSPSSHTVEAGSDDNTIRIVYRAAGTMDGGSVRLGTPLPWGSLQETDSAAKNYIRVIASSSVVNQDAIRYGAHNILVPLMTAGYNSTVEFVLSNVKAQTTIGLAQFTVESAGGASDGLVRLKGEPLPKDGDDNITDPYKLLGKVYVPNIALLDDLSNQAAVTAATGQLRLQVVPGAGGTGEAELVEIVRTDSGLQNYLDEDGEVIADRQVHAGDEEIYLVFRYTPVQTIEDGALRFTVPSDWSEPQEESSNVLGYTEISSSGSLGAYDFENRSITIPIGSITSGQNVEIHYGVGSLGAKAPTAKKTSQFLFAVKGTARTFTSIGAVDVDVMSQASGRGSASVESMNATAGAPDGSITITYDPIGQIANGRIKLTVPDALTGGADGDGVTASHISVSTGSAKYGGSVDLELDANADVTKNDVLVSGVNLGADDEFTFTYEGMMPEAAGDLAFIVAVDGGEGPGEVAEGSPDPMALIDGSGALTVTIGQAAAGSGTVMIDQGGAVVAGSDGNTITVTYTGIGEIGEGKTITVVVPDGWSAPLNEAAADEKMGTFTVTHLLDLAADDADGVRDEGDAVAASVMKAEGAAADAMPMIMVATVASGKKLAARDSVKFTYSNATAPTATGASHFTTEYDGMAVGEMDDVKVIVQSAEGATQLSVEADDFNVDTDGSTEVTIKLMASDGSVATAGAGGVTVTLTASSGTIASSVMIAAGEYMAMTDLSATAAANITVTASADGLTGAEIMVHADTDNVMITNVSLSESFAKAGDTVMVTASGTAAQDGMFSVGSVITDEDLTEDEAGSYTGSFTVVADLQDGTHTVTVSLNGASDDSASITIDTVAPTVSASGPTDPVSNGDMVTITAMPADAAPSSGIYKVMADVSMLDTTQADMVALTMGDDGSYSAEITISEDNEAANGAHNVTVTATDMAGNMSDMATVSVMLNNELTFTSTLPAGISLFSVPLAMEGLDTVGDLAAMLENESLLITYDGTTWNSRSDDVAITGDLGILVSMGAEESITFTGYAWGDGDATVSLRAGSNLVGLPVNDSDITNVSDIAGQFGAGIVTGVVVASGGEFQLVAAAGDAGDGPVAGDAAYLIMASAAGDAMLSGAGWMTDAASAAPIALSGYTVDSQTPVLDVLGNVVDEITGLTKEGFRVKVKNLSTKAALSNITSAEVSDGYNMTFVDLNDSHAARVGDVLEITADSPDPLVGIKPVRHIVTVDDVKNSRITLEDLIAYEIPAETELLRNYPNPFNPETWIPYHLSEDADVKLTIYDVNGALVRDIDVGHQTAAKYDTRSKAIYWDGRNQFGEQVASGIYFYSLEAGDFSATRKMVILK